MSEVYSLQELLLRGFTSLVLDDKSTFTFTTNYHVWNQGGQYGAEGSHVSHMANFRRDIANNKLLDQVDSKLKRDRTQNVLHFTSKLNDTVPISKDLCQLVAEFYVDKSVQVDDCIIEWTKISFNFPCNGMNIGVAHNAGGILVMYDFQGKNTTSFHLPSTLFWLKAPNEYGGSDLHANMSFTNPETNKDVYVPVKCTVEYKIHHVPNGRLLKQLSHLYSGYLATYQDSEMLAHYDNTKELCYNASVPMYSSIPRDLYDENETPRIIKATSSYKLQINNLLPNFYALVE
jgi:hypothetical protein